MCSYVIAFVEAEKLDDIDDADDIATRQAVAARIRQEIV